MPKFYASVSPSDNVKNEILGWCPGVSVLPHSENVLL